MVKNEPNEPSKNFYWKNIDDPRFGQLTPDVRDRINSRLKTNPIVDERGECRIEGGRLHLEFDMHPSKREVVEWKQRTRNKEVVKARIAIEAGKMKVTGLQSIGKIDDSLHIRSSEEHKHELTLFCFLGKRGIAYELYQCRPHQPSEREGRGRLRFILPKEIDEMEKATGQSPRKDKLGRAVFKIDPIDEGSVGTMVFKDKALIYSKDEIGTLEIDAAPSHYRFNF